MRIPRQPGGSSEPSRDRDDGPDCPLAGPLPASGATDRLRQRRRDLVAEQRAIGYWQRLVQARVDLVVAGLLYGAPAPVSPMVPVGTGAPLPATTAAAPGAPNLLTEPPPGLDVSLLLDHRGGDESPGARLERLRRAAVLLTDRRHRLDEELDAVTLALHDRLARDGEDAPVPAARSTAARDPA